MSLINEALKKAQRQRSDLPPGMTPADRMDHRGRPMRSQTIVLIIAGAAILVVFSVLITVFLVNRGSTAATPPVATVAPKTAPAIDTSAPAAVIVPPAITVPIPPPVAEKAVAKAPPPTETAPGAAEVIPPPVTSALPGAATTPAPVAVAPIPIPPVTTAPQPELKIQLFVDTIRVMGIRSSGGESKVLMNDRVFRVNDIVERTLGLKLIKVEPELLTFSDSNGMIYTKQF